MKMIVQKYVHFVERRLEKRKGDMEELSSSQMEQISILQDHTHLTFVNNS